MADYPNAVTNQSTAHADGTSEIIHASTINALAAEVNAIEAELGTLPKGVYATVKARLAQLETLNDNTQSGTTYTLVLTDSTRSVTCTNAAGCTLTVPPSSSVNFLLGTEIRVRAGASAGTITVAAGVGVTLRNPYSLFALTAQCAEAKLLKIGTDTWSLNGEVGP